MRSSLEVRFREAEEPSEVSQCWDLRAAFRLYASPCPRSGCLPVAGKLLFPHSCHCWGLGSGWPPHVKSLSSEQFLIFFKPHDCSCIPSSAPRPPNGGQRSRSKRPSASLACSGASTATRKKAPGAEGLGPPAPTRISPPVLALLSLCSWAGRVSQAAWCTGTNSLLTPIERLQTRQQNPCEAAKVLAWSRRVWMLPTFFACCRISGRK